MRNVSSGLLVIALCLVLGFMLLPGVFAEESKDQATGKEASVKVDAKIKAYVKADNVDGNINGIGSDTLNNLMTFWSEGFMKLYPNTKVQSEGKGSSTAPPALIEGTSQLGPMSREMKAEEIDKFEKKYGFKPTKIAVAVDCLAVYVHKDNPIKSLSLEELDGVFSKTRKRGGADITTWGPLGLDGDWKNLPISLYGRNSASGTYSFFKEHVLSKGDYKDTVKEQPGSAAVVHSVGTDKGAIGYSGIGYKTSDVRALPLSAKKGEKAVEPTFDNAMEKKYPLGRLLYIYIVKKPGDPLAPSVKEFLKYILSKEGQEIVIKDGYGPLPANVLEKQLKLLE